MMHRLVLLLILLSIPFIDVLERKGWAVIDTAFCFIAYGLVQGDQLPLILYCSDEIVDNALGRAPTIYQNRTPSIGQDGI